MGSKQNSDIKKAVERNIILFLLNSHPPVLFSYLSKQISKNLKKEFPHISKKKIQDTIRNTVNELIKKQILREKQISERIREIEIADTKKALDLISCTDARNPAHPRENNETSNVIELFDIDYVKLSLLPKFSRMSSLYYATASRYFLRSANTISKEDISEITAKFELYISDISQRVLIFIDSENEIRIKNYRSRFITESEAIEKIKQFEEAFNIAKRQYDNGIFLTITLPPIFPIKLSLWILSFLLHRTKALIRKKHKETLPHIRVNEPQRSFNPHVHVIIFGIDYLMKKHDLTRYLDEHLESFLDNLGDYYKTTINKRAKEEQIKALNRFGKKMLKKYKRYKQKKNTRSPGQSYEGPINHITRISIQHNDIIFNNPPPDYRKSRKEKDTETMNDGGHVSVFDYLKYYLISNLIEARENEDEPTRKQKPELAFYWLLRIPFFYTSPTLRNRREKPPPAGWRFICSTYEDMLQEILNN